MNIKITTPTLINDKNITDMSENEIIRMIKNVEQEALDLGKVTTPSKRIIKLIKECNDTAKKLVVILDKM